MLHPCFHLEEMKQHDKENRLSSGLEAYNLLAALFGLFLGRTHGKSTQEHCKDVVRLCRGKIRRDKAHLELNLANAVKDNKKMFL